MEKIDTRGNELNTFGNSSLSNHFECLKDNNTIYYVEGVEKSQEFLKNHNINTITKTSTTAIKFSADQGRIGIKNLGNTCYMNSALQCLGHTRELLNYFISGEYKKDLIKQEDKDVESELLYYFSTYFGDFIHELWSDSREAINPNNLRNTLIKIYPQFDNNFQQDAHEVLTLILDSLHQQLNRVKNDDDKITGDMELFFQLSQRENSLMLSKHQSQYFWNSHKILNDSIITDLFFGQLISTIKCLNCFETYNTFEPFSSLGLSIPNEYKIFLYFVPMKKNYRAIKIFLKINDNMQFKSLIEKVKDVIEYKFKNGVFYWVSNNKFIKLVDPDERCGDLLNRTSFLFLIEVDCDNDQENSKINQDFNNPIITDKDEFVHSYNDYFYICLNFNMFNTSSDSTKNKEIKIISYPRIFNYDNKLILEKKEISDVESFDEDKKIKKIFDPIISYIKNFIQSGEDFMKYLENEALFFTVKSVNIQRYNIESSKKSDTSTLNGINKSDTFSSKDSNFLCLFCGKENPQEFLCNCINKWLFNNILDFDSVNISIANLKYFLNNLMENQKLSEVVIEVNINISVEILKFLDLNRCKDNTQKYIPDNGINFYNLLDYFTGDEKLTLSDNYYCNTCKKIVIAYKKMQINKTPQILVVNLKRFRYETCNSGKSRVSRRNNDNFLLNSNNFSGEKKENMIDFPINNLDLTKYNRNNIPVFYELFAICNHQGKISSGHYTAICRHPTSYKWIEYDDKLVKNYPETNLITSNAYLLFYRKKLNS